MQQIRKLLLYLSMILLVSTCIPTTKANAAEKLLKVHYINVGESDCTLIQYGDKYMMIDAGDTDDSNTILNYLKKQKVSELDYLILTHPHADHIGSAEDVMNSVKINQIIMPAVTHTTKTYEDVLRTIKAKKIKVTKPVVGNKYSLGKASFVILAPNHYNYGSNTNNYSISIKLTYKSTRFLFTGDCETEAISDILKNGYDLTADVIMCGHHGSDTSTSAKFLDAVHPSYAVISVGKNSYGHPCKETLTLLAERKIKTYRTDESGSICFTSDGKKISTKAKESINKALSTGQNSTSTPPKKTSSSNSNSTNQTDLVYITKTGNKYHKKGCRYLRSSMTKITLKEAKKENYTPCSVCN